MELRYILYLAGWLVVVAIVVVFNYGAHSDNYDINEPDESSHKGRYKYTHPDDDENVIF